jgi:hypothetical protein
MATPDFGQFERNQPHNLFNDRRIGGKAKNRAVGENMYGFKKQPPKGENGRPDAGGTRVPKKPKPKFPSTPMALKIK